MNSKYSTGSVEAHKKKKPVGVGRAGGRLLDLDRRGDRQRLVLQEVKEAPSANIRSSVHNCTRSHTTG